MKRLTHIDHIGWYVDDQSAHFDERIRGKDVDRLAAYEDTGLEPVEVSEYKHLCDSYVEAGLDSKFVQFCIDATQNGLSIDRICELAQAEKGGRLVVLPCKVGDVVYEANKRGFISTYKVISAYISARSVVFGWRLVDGIASNVTGFNASTIGKTVFRTREEAEAALKKGEEADNEAD